MTSGAAVDAALDVVTRVRGVLAAAGMTAPRQVDGPRLSSRIVTDGFTVTTLPDGMVRVDWEPSSAQRHQHPAQVAQWRRNNLHRARLVLAQAGWTPTLRPATPTSLTHLTIQ